MYTEPKITIDLEEYLELKKTIETLTKPAEGGELSPIELQEATGILLQRALQNPRIFYGQIPEIPIGKYKAQLVYLAQPSTGKDSQILVKLVRT